MYNKIIEQLDRIKLEAKEHRDYLKQLGLYAAGKAFLIGGVAVTVRNKEIGGHIVKKGLEAFKNQI